MNKCVSVIIPVFNAESYLRISVESALQCLEVGEIILVEDGSIDSSLRVCQKLQAEFPSEIRLFRHGKGENRGAGASRNLGLRNAAYEYIAFLDADDYYLEDRFLETVKILDGSLEVDGVYCAVGTEVTGGKEGIRDLEFKPDGTVTAVKKPIRPEKLFSELLPKKRHGYFCTDGITLRKSLIHKIGEFNEDLALHQDTEYWLRASYHGALIGLSDLLTPLAIRRVHSANRIHGRSFKSRSMYYQALFRVFSPVSLRFRDRLVICHYAAMYSPDRQSHSTKFKSIKYIKLVIVELRYMIRSLKLRYQATTPIES